MEANSKPREPQVNEAASPYASKRLAVLTLAGLSLMFLVSVLYRPSAVEYFTICGFKNLTGLPCPGCGLTHSFCALGKGDITGAFAFNLLGPLLFTGFAMIWMRSVGVVFDRTRVVRMFDQVTERINLVRTFAIAFAVYGVARIIYLLAANPRTFSDSPLSQLIARLVH